jgi:hypothetical protein
LWHDPNKLSAPTSQVLAINDSGDAVGVWGEDNTPTEEAFLYRGGVLTGLGPVLATGSQANGINNSGIVVGVCGILALGAQGFVYDSVTQAAPILIHQLPGQNMYPTSIANAVNNHGAVVGVSGDHGFLFVDNGLVDLGPAAFVTDINDSGVVVGTVIDPTSQLMRAAYWKTGRNRHTAGHWDYYADPPVEIPLPPGCVMSQANAINNHGDVVGACWYPGGDVPGGPGGSAFIGNIALPASQDINLWSFPLSPQLSLQWCSDINDRRQVVGVGSSNGNALGFVAGVHLFDNTLFGPYPV